MTSNAEAALRAADEIKRERLAALEKSGLTFEYLIDKLKGELDAQETKFFQFRGQVIDQESVIDWQTRQKARMDAHKLRGDYPAERKEVDIGVKGLSDEAIDRKLEQLMTKLKESNE